MEDLLRLEAAFLLGMDGDMRRQRYQRRSTGNSSRGDNDGGDDGLAAGFGFSDHRLATSSGATMLGRTRGLPRRVQVGSGRRGISSTHLDTAELYMRGVSEEEQLAMAIAMSMQDQQQTQNEGGREALTNSTAETNEEDLRNENESTNVTEPEEESSSDSSEGIEEEESGGSNNINAHVIINASASINNADAISLDEDEEEVVFNG